MNLSEDKTTELQDRLESTNEDYDDNMDARDWESCDYIGHSINLYKYLLNGK